MNYIMTEISIFDNYIVTDSGKIESVIFDQSKSIRESFKYTKLNIF